MSRGRISSRSAIRLAAALSLAVCVAGCESLQDTFDDINPFGDKDTPLPGDRRPVFEGSRVDPATIATRQAAAIGPARANDDWPQSGGTAANDPGHLAYSGGSSRAWTAAVRSDSNFRVGFSNTKLRIGARPVVGGGRIYVYAPGAVVSALSLSGGGRAWQRELRPEGEGDISGGGGAAYDAGRLYVATSYSQVAGLDAGNGAVIWTKDLEAPARGSPTAVDGKVFVVTQTNVVYALNQADGTELWSFRGIPETAGLLAAANPAVLGDTVVVPYSSGEVVGLNVATGEPRWSNTLVSPSRTYVLSSTINDVSGSPVIDGSTVFAAGVAGETIAVDFKTGEQKWSQEVGSAHTPIVSGNAVFLIDLDDNAVALDRNTGAPMWSTKLPVIATRQERSHWAGPVLAGGALWFVSSDSKLAQVDPASGALTATVPIGQPSYIAPIVASGTMVVVGADGSVSAFR